MSNGLLLILGIAVLAIGGEALIRGALGISKQWGVSPLLSGLVIVGFGTSMPELVVSIDAVLSGQSDIAVGNIVGSNIANTLLILGLCAAITALTVTPSALSRDAVIVMIASTVFVGLGWDKTIGRFDALLLLAILIAYLVWAYRSEKALADPAAEVHEAEAAELNLLPNTTLWSIVAVMLGLALLIGGSQLLLKGAVGIAQTLGVSEAVIGLTLVAVGTSLPELTISLIAALRHHADVAVGNVLGSNIFNLLGILGIAALVKPMEISTRILEFDQWVMLGITFILFVFLYTGRRVSRLEGGVLLTGYLVYSTLSYLR